jgi:UDP-N-acetylglucosamine diphosphorylase/glucosamine-1-phosphate N-acetyltransferase
MRNILFFDDIHVRGLDPITTMRAAADIRCGIHRIAKKWRILLQSDNVNYYVRSHLKPLYMSINRKYYDTICINGRWLPDEKSIEEVNKLQMGEGLVRDGVLLACRVGGANLGQLQERTFEEVSSLSLSDCDAGKTIDRVSDVFTYNEEQTMRDIALMQTNAVDRDWPGVMMIDRESIRIGQNVTIEPGVVLIPDGGLIHIGDGAILQAGALIRGTVSIGKGSTVRMGAHVYHGTTVGPLCKVGGELQNVVFQGYANKAHGGYLGNSVVGKWVNIGADANTSNLKNNYTSIRIEDWHTGGVEDTGLTFYGTIFGDHCKVAIGSKLNSGTQFGVSSSFVSNDFSPKRVPHFGWVTDSGIEPFEIERALQTARAMMARRGVELSKGEEAVLRGIASDIEHRASSIGH